MTKQQKQEEALRQQIWEQIPPLVDRLVSLAAEEDAKPTTIVAAIKEIKAVAEELRSVLPQKVEITVKIIDP